MRRSLKDDLIALVFWFGVAFFGKWLGHWYGATIGIFGGIIGLMVLFNIVTSVLGGYMVYRALKNNDKNDQDEGN